MISNKCPKCGAEVAEQLHRGAAVYKCATRYFPERGRIIAHWQQSASCGLAQLDQLAAELDRLKAENEKLRELVYDAYAEGEQDARTGEGGWNESVTKSEMDRLEGRVE